MSNEREQLIDALIARIQAKWPNIDADGERADDWQRWRA